MLSNKEKEIDSIWRSGWLSMLLWIVVHRDSKPGQHRICRGTKRNFKSHFEEIKCSISFTDFVGKEYGFTDWLLSKTVSLTVGNDNKSWILNCHKCHNYQRVTNVTTVTNITNVANIKKQCIILVDHSLFLVSLLWHLLTGPPMTYYYDIVLLTHWILFVGQNSYYYKI